MKLRKLMPILAIAQGALDYKPCSGEFRWITPTATCMRPGDAAGCIKSGVVHICLKGYSYLAHRLAWLLHYKEEPPTIIDHIDGNPLNNRISNLRAATRSQNQYNQKVRRDNTSGFKGVCWDKQAGKWRAYIRFNGKNKHLGLFNTPEVAHSAYCAAATKFFGEYANTGIRAAADSKAPLNKNRVRVSPLGEVMPRGVHWNTRAGRYAASTGIGGYSRNLGLFDTPEDAHAAYCKAIADYSGK